MAIVNPPASPLFTTIFIQAYIYIIYIYIYIYIYAYSPNWEFPRLLGGQFIYWSYTFLSRTNMFAGILRLAGRLTYTLVQLVVYGAYSGSSY